MKLVVGATYTVAKTDGTTITFKFIGGGPPMGEVDGERILLTKILEGYILAYWEIS